MHLIRLALPAIATSFPPIAAEATMMCRLLVDSQGCLADLPTPVLLAGFRVIAKTAGLPTAQRRGCLGEAVRLLLEKTRKEPESEDVVAAVRVWGTALARASQLYGALVASSHHPTQRTATAGADATYLAGFMSTLALDLRVLTAESEQVRGNGSPRDQMLAEVREFVAEGRLKRRARPQSTQTKIEWETVG